VTKTSPSSHLLSGALGGLIAVVIGAILIAAGVIDTGDDKTVVRGSQAGGPGAADAERGPSGRTVNDIYRRTGRGVAFIQARVTGGGEEAIPGLPTPRGGRSTGSGFALDRNGYILTNAHVVENAKDVTVRFGDEPAIDAKVEGADPSTDLAVLKLDPRKSKGRPLPLGDSSRVRVGDPVIAIGNPFGLDHTVTTGIVSALQRSIQAPNGFSIDNVIQTDASINPGNSGGPLLDSSGRVIGINSQIETGGSGNGSVGIGFAIPINTAKKVVPQLKSSGHVKHPYIGVTTAPLPDSAQDLNLPVDQGALVQDVTPGSPADRAGLRAGKTETAEGIVIGGDLIVKVDGKDIHQPQDVAGAISDRKPGDKITIEFFRGRQKRSVQLTLGERPDSVSGGGSRGSKPKEPKGLLPERPIP
jgi:S1-C subfamily serine protease